MTAELLIQHGTTGYIPCIEEGITLELERKGTPGKLKFSVVNDGALTFEEGDPCKLSIDGTAIFYGFIFTKSTSAKTPEVIDCVAYDQLRYLKNKETYCYTNKTVAEVVQMIASDFGLNCGTLEDSGYKIASRVEDNTTLFDIIQNAVDETLRATTRLYVLYDDVGKLTLQNIENMRLGLLIDAETAGDYDYKSTIDDKTYNQIKVVYEDSDSKKRSVYMARDSSHINSWGLLQLTETVEQPTSGASKADALLQLYNAKTKTLTVKDALGDIRVRAGTSLVVNLQLEDMTVQSMMVVESVKHTFKNEQHLMTLKLRGGLFVT